MVIEAPAWMPADTSHETITVRPGYGYVDVDDEDVVVVDDDDCGVAAATGTARKATKGSRANSASLLFILYHSQPFSMPQ